MKQLTITLVTCMLLIIHPEIAPGEPQEYHNDTAVEIVIDRHDITEESNIAAWKLERALKGTALAGLGQAYVDAENAYGINAIYLMSITILESDWGKSRLARNKNNISGFKAYDRDPYNSALYFKTKADCIMTTARALREGYIGRGLYSIRSIGGRYASDPGWAGKVISIANKAMKKIGE